MNRSFRKAFQTLLPLQQSLIGTGPKVATSTGTHAFLGCTNHNGSSGFGFIPQRSIHHLRSQVILVLQARRRKEKFRHPERFEKPQPRNTFAEWNYKAELFAVGKRLGEEFEESLLKEALTDMSFIHKERQRQAQLGLDPDQLQMKHNEELGLLGSQLTHQFLTQFLQKEFPLFPPEGHKAVVKNLTSLETMATVSSNLGLTDLILCEEYPPTEETYTRALYALIGALDKSSNNNERTRKFVIDFIASLLCGQDINDLWDISRPWQLMVQLAQERNLYPVEPRLIREAGRNTVHSVFVVGIYDKDKKLIGTGIGETLDIGQEMAARDVLKGFFNTRDPRPPFQFQSQNIPYKLVPHVRSISQ